VTPVKPICTEGKRPSKDDDDSDIGSMSDSESAESINSDRSSLLGRSIVRAEQYAHACARRGAGSKRKPSSAAAEQLIKESIVSDDDDNMSVMSDGSGHEGKGGR
jgi:hypothetical protein